MVKKLQKQILLAIVFIGNVFSMQGMMMLQRARLPRLQVARYKNLTKSFFLQKPVNSVVSQAEVSSPFSIGRQKRSYSSFAPKQTGPGLRNWISSFFVQNSVSELRAKGIEGIMHELLYPEHTKEVVDKAGLTRNIRSFDENDLKKAKEKIGQILELNENYKTSIVRKNTSWFSKDNRSGRAKDLRTEDSVFKTVLFGFYSDNFGNWKYRFEGTILDEVLYKVFSGEWSTCFYTTADNVLHYIQLAQWLTDKGLKIEQPDNEKNYMLGYAHLMTEYEDLYRPRSFGRDSMRCIDEDSFKKIFTALDHVLERLIVKPELKQELHQFQQERREIEANPQAYREKLKEKDRRDEYISRKAQILEQEYINRTGDWNKDSSSFKKYVQFDELEYEEWKKTGYLRGEKEKLEQERQQRDQWNKFKQTIGEVTLQVQQKIEELKERFKLPSNASAGMIMQDVKDYIKQQHPDTLKSRQDISPKEKYKKAKEYGEFIGRYYDDVIEELKRCEKREKQARESRE